MRPALRGVSAPFRDRAEADAALARVMHGSTAEYWRVVGRWLATP